MLVLGTLMIPDQLRLVPIYQMLVNMLPSWVGHLGWQNATFTNRNGVILINLVSAASLFLMRQYFLTIPRDLEEAAKLDGAGYFKTYRRVMLPLAGPALAAVCILTFQGSWNGLFWPAVLLQDESQRTIPLGLVYFQTDLYDVVASADGRERGRDSAGARALRAVPALLRRRRRGFRGQGMSLARALGVAATDLYHQSWRLIVLNALLGRGPGRSHPCEPGDSPGTPAPRLARPRRRSGHALHGDSRPDGGAAALRGGGRADDDTGGAGWCWGSSWPLLRSSVRSPSPSIPEPAPGPGPWPH